MPRIPGPKTTSRDAYAKHVIEGKATSQRERIFRYILNETLHGRSVTRSRIAKQFRPVTYWPHEATRRGNPPIPLSSVTPRVHALVKAGIVEVSHTTKNERGNPVEWLVAVLPSPDQRKFDL